MLTGALPEIHGIKNNNLGQTIRVEALPDLVKTRLYGSMHIKHFSKPCWDTEIVSLPTHSIYKCDDIMFDALKNDLGKKDSHRLFIADISETDFLGHVYGSESRQYLEALKRADRRIGQFFAYLEENNFLNETIVIICSDHGIIRVDHSYLLFKAEKFVPFIITGKMIKADNPLTFEASIMDIAPTISYLLGVRYPGNCSGRVFTEVVK
jgi:predicted AlkP superfamily pyrophosphatase or phosphodiesterase